MRKRTPSHDFHSRRALLRDAPALATLSRAAITESAATHYTTSQLAAWARRRTVTAHERMITETHVIVAETDTGIAGFASVALHPIGSLVAGEVDQLFAHPTYTGHGVAGLLLEAIETRAREAGLDRLVTHASLRAAPIFARAGYQTEYEETVRLDDEVLARFLMRKKLRD